MSQKRRYPIYAGAGRNNLHQQTDNTEQIEQSGFQVPVIEAQGDIPNEPVFVGQQQPQQLQTQPFIQDQPDTSGTWTHADQQQLHALQAETMEPQVNVKRSEVIQFTHSVLPTGNNDLQTYKLPVGFIIQPLRDEDMPTVDFNSELRMNPPRCNDCKAFMSCYSTFTESGRYICTLCGMESQLDIQYKNMMMNPQIRAQRPEMTSESYEILAPDAYRIRKTETFESLVFLIDISPQSIQSGLVKLAADLIKQQLQYLRGREERTMVSVILFNTQVHLFIIRSDTALEVYTVPDAQKVCVPAPRDVIVSLRSRTEPIMKALDNLPQIAAGIPSPSYCQNAYRHNGNDVAFLAAIETAQRCMQNVGGKVLFFLSCMPSCGVGSCHERAEERSAAGKTTGQRCDVKQALTPCIENYTDIGVLCAQCYVSIDGIVATQHEYCELASLCELCRLSGGVLRHIPDFDPGQHAGIVGQYVKDAVWPGNALETCLRIRTSRSIEIRAIYGQGQQTRDNMITLAHCNSRQAVGAEIALTEPPRAGAMLYVQLSCLYTDRLNRRLVRVVNKRLRVGSATHFLQSLHVPSQVCLLAKKVSRSLRRNAGVSSSAANYIDALTNTTISQALSSTATLEGTIHAVYGQIIAAVRQYAKLTGCTQFSQMSPKIQELICYCFALSKSPMIRPVGSKVYVDERASFQMAIDEGSVEHIYQLVYPACVDIDCNRVRLCAENLQNNQIYCLAGQYSVYVYIGAGVDYSVIQQLTVGQTDVNLQHFIPLNLNADTEYARKLSRAVQSVQTQIGFEVPVVCVTGHGKLAGPIYNLLIESRVDGMCFVDFVKMVAQNMDIMHK